MTDKNVPTIAVPVDFMKHVMNVLNEVEQVYEDKAEGAVDSPLYDKVSHIVSCINTVMIEGNHLTEDEYTETVFEGGLMK